MMILTRVAAVSLVSVLAALGSPLIAGSAIATGCPEGYKSWSEHRLEERELLLSQHGELRDLVEAHDQSQDDELSVCISTKHPEDFAAIAGMQGQRLARAAAPFGEVPPGAYRNAVQERDALALAATSVPNTDGRWRPHGRGPLISDHADYGSVNSLGLAELNGRIDSLEYDSVHDRLFASIGTGGVWMSTDRGRSWSSISESMPTQVNGAIGWSEADGGTLVAVSGEPLMGGNTYTGLGAFWTSNLGRTWHQAAGIPDGAMGFQIAVDPANPRRIYAATSMGLYRSVDTGRTYTNVALPTGDCAGRTGYGNECQFANFVTDVVVQPPGGTTNEDGGTVLAAVGYRAGKHAFPDGKIHSTHNGLYRSTTGAPGSFEELDVSGDGASPVGFAPQENIGRTELGVAEGKDQNHNYVYAIVQDAELFNGAVPSIDVPEDPAADDQALYNTSFNGIYVSEDFGESWIRMADTAEVSENPATGSSLAGTGQATLFAPGVQAWYNMWIKPDPTRQTEDGVPTRLTFGLEEVWQNRVTDAPQNQPQQHPQGDFKVIGPYFADETCLLLDNPTPVCPTSDPPTTTDLTTHPDQHDALYVPTEDGVSFIVGNDGGAYVQTVKDGQEFVATGWPRGNNDGFHTLLPYSAEVAKDGTVWYGLQDNGSGKITPDQKQYMTFGGDGFFVAVDPNNSDVAYSETTFASMRVTKDGGKTWRAIPPPVSETQFSNPFVMDPTDASHLMTAGNEIVETVSAPDVCTYVDSEPVLCEWEQVFALGNAPTPGGDALSMTALDLHRDAAYVGYCGVCDVLNQDTSRNPFYSGLATNVGGNEPPKRMTSQGWHHADAKGLPNRYISSIAIDPKDPKTVYVALGGYANREWVPPGSYGDKTEGLGSGHIFKSTDAGKTFKNISANLPNASATWIEIHENQLLLGTEVGVFISKNANGGEWAVLGDGLPTVPVSTIRNHPGDPWTVVVATFGRGVYTYEFPGRPAEAKKKAPDGGSKDKGDEVLGTRQGSEEPPPAASDEVQGGSLAATGVQILLLLLISGGLMGAGAVLTKMKDKAGGWNP
jgi:hypothetical protein